MNESSINCPTWKQCDKSGPFGTHLASMRSDFDTSRYSPEGRVPCSGLTQPLAVSLDALAMEGSICRPFSRPRAVDMPANGRPACCIDSAPATPVADRSRSRCGECEPVGQDRNFSIFPLRHPAVSHPTRRSPARNSCAIALTENWKGGPFK
jgi:hypothetical protein